MKTKNISLIANCFFLMLPVFFYSLRPSLFAQSKPNYKRGYVTIILPKDTLRSKQLGSIYKKDKISIEVDIAIGGNTADEKYLLSQPREFSIDSRGNIFILDFQENCIKKFDSTGIYIRTISRAGKGPGEILNPSQLAIDPDDNIVTWDFGNMRFSFFNNDGDFLYSVNSLKLFQFPEMILDFKFDHSGFVYVATRIADFSGQEGGSLLKIIQYSKDFTNKKIVVSTKIKDEEYISKPVSTNVPVPFCPGLYWDIMPTGNIVIGYSKDYTIELYSPQLKLLHKMQHQSEQIEITKEDEKAYFSKLKGMAGDFSSGSTKEISAIPKYIRNATKFPKFKPYFKNLQVDNEGYIIIHTYKKEENLDVYDVFASDLNFVNRLKLPFLYSPFFLGGYIYDLKMNGKEFPSLVRYRLK